MEKYNIKFLDKNYLDKMLPLIQQLNPNVSISVLQKRQIEMFLIENYKCFGIFDNNNLIGLTSAWITVRLYSGKQLELDNLIIDKSIQSKGIGKYFLSFIDNWAKNNNFISVELNTYIQNSRSHKLYFNLGYRILGFHFQKYLNPKKT